MISAPMPVATRAAAPVVPPPALAASGPTLSIPVAAKPNPSTQLDLTLGITVLTFHDASGQVIATTPTQAQLNTYLLYGASQSSAPRANAPAHDVSGVALVA